MKKTDKTIRILIADDHAVIRDGLSMILGLQDDFVVVGQAQDGQEAVQLAHQLNPDVVVMDMMMPKLDGCAAVQKITAENRDVHILILTSYTESSKIVQAIHGGACGAIGKNAPREELLSAIRSVATGKAAGPTLRLLSDKLTARVPGLSVTVREIENRFFGPEITVSGLLTGKDMAEQLAGCDLGDAVLISACTLRAEGDLFLCGMTPHELAQKLGVPVVAVDNDGASFLAALLGQGGRIFEAR